LYRKSRLRSSTPEAATGDETALDETIAPGCALVNAIDSSLAPETQQTGAATPA